MQLTSLIAVYYCGIQLAFSSVPRDTGEIFQYSDWLRDEWLEFDLDQGLLFHIDKGILSLPWHLQVILR